ncbi:hypothetical protein CDAR_528791 [Caerostris darwini]|uniref:Uncharacterized protein n=1 Tax=Caerostris darwini TaxID=1538125 RepID=A0AAV4UNY5_9ARAC|nr:hypothetical protein CDAR_528791 [Caerostris darwini]
MADGKKTIVLVTDQEAERQGVVRDHHPFPVNGRHVNPGASPVPCGQCLYILKNPFILSNGETMRLPTRHRNKIDSSTSRSSLQHTRRTSKTVLSALNPALLGHNPSVSPLSGLPHIRFDPLLPRSLISIRQGGTSS